MIVTLDDVSHMVFHLSDRDQHAAVIAALTGAGKPAGVRSCESRDDDVIVRVDAGITPLALVRHLVEVEAGRFEHPTQLALGELDDAALARLVAEAIQDPDLSAERILEVRVPELDR